MIIFGRRLFGKTDAVPGVFHVATQCYHVNFVPMATVKTYLFVGTRAVAIPQSGRSIAAAWARTLSVYGTVLSSIFVLATLSDYRYSIAPLIASVAVFLFFCWLIYFAFCGKQLNYATYERASELCSHLGALGPTYQRKVDEHFSKLNSQEKNGLQDDGVEITEVSHDDDEELLTEQGFRDEV